jgi:hypothetical protein
MTLSNIRLCSCCMYPVWDTGTKLEVDEWRQWSWDDILEQGSSCDFIPCNVCKEEAEELGITLEELHQRKEI